MIIVCAWCEQEGRGDGAVLGEKEPLDDKNKSHGSCGEHLAKTYAAMGPKLPASARVRYIEWPSLYIEHGEGG